MIIDSHQHFWHYDPYRDTWITNDMAILQQDFMPEDLAPLLEAHHIAGSVAVQASQSDEETHFLVDLATQVSSIVGVVGWTNLCSYRLAATLEHWKDVSKLLGFRHIVQSEKEGFLLQRSFQKGVCMLGANDFSYDLLIYERQLGEAAIFLDKLPEMRIIIDHIAKPEMSGGPSACWKKGMKKLAKYPHVFVKISGLITEANWNKWSAEQFYPYLDTCLELFGPDRMLFGSDWPVCLLAGSYSEVTQLIQTYIGKLSAAEQAKILGQNALIAYKIPAPVYEPTVIK